MVDDFEWPLFAERVAPFGFYSQVFRHKGPVPVGGCWPAGQYRWVGTGPFPYPPVPFDFGVVWASVPNPEPILTRLVPPIFTLLVVATVLEACGDAMVRLGLRQESLPLRVALFLMGAALLFGYGVFVNLPAVEFGRIAGLYIATLFVVWQVVNLAVFGTLPPLPVVAGGVLIVIGGCIVTFWGR